MRRTAILVGVCTTVIAMVASPADAIGLRNERTQVVLTGRVDVAEGERVGTIVIFHGPATIAGDVNGSLWVFDGDLTLAGSVRDDVTVFNGNVSVESGARIGGDLTT